MHGEKAPREVVAENEAIIEVVVRRHPLRSVVREARVFEQDSRFEPRSDILADPGEFELVLGHMCSLPDKESPAIMLLVGGPRTTGIMFGHGFVGGCTGGSARVCSCLSFSFSISQTIVVITT